MGKFSLKKLLGSSGATKAAPAADSPPPLVPVPGSPAFHSDAGRMVFPLDKGELPNLVQFLNMGRRTGVLELDFYLLKLKGSIYFRDGEAYCARYEELRGLEALARMIQRSKAKSYFTNGVTVDEVNLDIPMSNLLVEAVVMADEQVDVEGAAAEESASVNEESLSAAAEAAGVRGESPPKAAPSRAKMGVKLAAVVLAVLVAAGGFVAYRKVSTAYTAANPPPQHVVGTPTTPAPGGAKVEAAKGLITVAPIKWEAEKGLEQVRVLEGGAGFDAPKTGADNCMKAAKASFDAADYDKAMTKYQEALTLINGAVALEKKRQGARQQKTYSMAFRLKAEGAGGPLHAKADWEAAVAKDTAAATEFKAGSYADAETHWIEANETYQKAEVLAQKRQLLNGATAGYEAVIQKVDPVTLDTYGGAAWQEVKKLVADGAALASEGKLAEAAEKYARARESVSAAIADADKARTLADYRRAMARALAAVENSQWEEAEKAYADALKVPGYSADPTALRGVEDARLRGLMVGAEAAKAKGQWAQVLTLAEGALKVNAKYSHAKDLITEARENLIPRLVITAAMEGKAMAAARVFVNKLPQVGRLPMTLKVDAGKTYEIRVEVPPDGNTYYVPFETKYLVKSAGLQTVKADVLVVKAPEPGQNWSMPELDMVFMPIKPGPLLMGAENARKDELPVRKVTMTRYFWMCKYEVTNGQYRKFVALSGYQGAQDVGNENLYLQHFSKGKSEMSELSDYPVCYVSWNNAAAFGKWLTEFERKGGRLPAGYVYRLPTEAEWEYCCRAGTTGDFSNSLDECGWYFKNSNHTQKVGSLVANPWGIHDMHGNVYEWCHDWMGPYDPAEVIDPKGPDSGMFVVIRGGSWNSSAELCRSSWRGTAAKVDSRLNLGFRLVLGPKLGP